MKVTVNKLTLYKLYTECKNEAWLKILFSRYFDGYTVYHTDGVWKGIKENSLVFEIITAHHLALRDLREIVQKIKEHNQQESVLLTGQSNIEVDLFR